MKKIVVAAIVCSLLIACSNQRMSKKKALDYNLYQYAKVIRWADYNTALTFLSPHIDKAHNPSILEIERLKQFNVSSYVAAPIKPGFSENEIIQDVQIKLYNLHTKRERVVVDRQVWEYDDEAKTWWLTSGLPKIVSSRH